jgi:hypothetical protein
MIDKLPRDSERNAAAEALPRLRALRTELESRGGKLHVQERNYTRRLVACAGAAGLTGLYAISLSVTSAPPVLAWVMCGGFSAGTLLLRFRWNNAEASRAQVLETLHTKMLAVSQHIDKAERTLRR